MCGDTPTARPASEAPAAADREPLARVRRAIDAIDDALLLLLAARVRLARRAERCKRDAGLPLRDPQREARVHARAQALAARIGLPAATARRAIGLAIDEACREQGLAADPDHPADVTAPEWRDGWPDRCADRRASAGCGCPAWRRPSRCGGSTPSSG